jgi:hypothetical protein
MCFAWISEQKAIISLYSINWLVCTTKTESVYCAIRTGYLYRVRINYRWIFAKQYFHKYWTEIHDVTTIWKGNVYSWLYRVRINFRRIFCKTVFSQILNINTWCYYHLKEECLQLIIQSAYKLSEDFLQNRIFTNTKQKYMMLLPFERGMFIVDYKGCV